MCFPAAQRIIWDFNKKIPLLLTDLLATQPTIWDFRRILSLFSSSRKFWDFNEEIPYFDAFSSRAAKILSLGQGNFQISTREFHYLDQFSSRAAKNLRFQRDSFKPSHWKFPDGNSTVLMRFLSRCEKFEISTRKFRILTRLPAAQRKFWDSSTENFRFQPKSTILTSFLAAQRKIGDFNKEIPLFLTDFSLTSKLRFQGEFCHCFQTHIEKI